MGFNLNRAEMSSFIVGDHDICIPRAGASNSTSRNGFIVAAHSGRQHTIPHSPLLKRFRYRVSRNSSIFQLLVVLEGRLVVAILLDLSLPKTRPRIDSPL
jgi:hypothetical protein